MIEDLNLDVLYLTILLPNELKSSLQASLLLMRMIQMMLLGQKFRCWDYYIADDDPLLGIYCR